MWTLRASLAAFYLLFSSLAGAQELTGALIGSVRDEQGGALAGARVQISSPVLLSGPESITTNECGAWRFPVLPPGSYVMTIEMSGFASSREADIRIGAGSTLERTVILKIAGVAESVIVEGAGSRVDARATGFETRFDSSDVRSIPTRRSSMFDFIRSAAGVSATSPSSGTITTISAFGSGTNENQFLIDGTNFTCPCSGIARSEPGIDFIQEVQVQSAGASAEFGNVQGAVINVVMRQGTERYLSDVSYYGQSAGLTSQPVLRPINGPQTGYERIRYRDLTGNVGGPAIRNRLWFFAGYQYLRDYDSQPAADPNFPRIYEQNKAFAKLTWNLAPAWRLMQSVHDEHLVASDTPTSVTPFSATATRTANVPAVTLGELTHSGAANTLWDVRVGRFVFAQKSKASSGDPTAMSRFDNVTGVTSSAPQSLGSPTVARTTAKATVSWYRAGFLHADHESKVGAQFERGGHHAVNLIPAGTRFTDSAGQPVSMTSTPPFNIGGMADTASVFASDAITLNARTTISAGLRFDHSRAFSQDLPALDSNGQETDTIVAGLGTLYVWNIVSPRLGVTTRLSADGRTVLRGSYGRFSQGVLTGEFESFHPGQTATTTAGFDPATGGYTRNITIVDPRKNLQLDPDIRAPHSDEYSLGVDREIRGGLSVAVAYMGKHGSDFIGWTDVGGQYRESTQTLRDGRVVPSFELLNGNGSRLFRLTNPDGYSLTYNGLVLAAEKRRSHGWEGSASYTFSRTEGLQVSSGTTAAGAQVSTVAPPPSVTFGRDPNDLTNARGRLPNDRPHIARVAGAVEIPRTGIMMAANFRYFSGKPWAASALINVPQNPQPQRILIEPRGSRRLSSQSLLDWRLSRTIALRSDVRVDLLLDILNLLNDTAEESIVTDYLFSPAFNQPNVFIDPRRAMLGARVNFGR
jgi:hypothetical protein